MEKKKKRHKFLKRFAVMVAVLVVLLLGILLFVRSPWGQNIIISKVTKYVSNKTNTKVEIDRLFLTFSGNLSLEGLYLEDKKGDTLLYSKDLEADIALSPLFFGNEFNLKSAKWEGLRANIARDENSEVFNFNFLLEALIPKDTTAIESLAEPMQINIGALKFGDFKVDYEDDFLGIESKLNLGNLSLEAHKTDLENLRFELNDLQLSNSKIYYKQTKPFVAEDTAQSPLPCVIVDNLELKYVDANYNSIPDSVLANVNIGILKLQLPKADVSKNNFDIALFSLKNSKVSLQLPKETDAASGLTKSTVDSPIFEWPEFLVNTDKIVLENNKLSYKSGNTQNKEGQFNPDDIVISDLTLDANNLNYRPENFKLQLQEISFFERSGFQLRNLGFYAHLDDTKTSLSNLNLSANSSFVHGALALQYPSVQQLFESPENTKIEAHFPDFKIAIEDAFYFQQQLSRNEYIQKSLQHPFTGNLTVEGTLDTLQIREMRLNWGQNTTLTSEGNLNHVAQIDSLSFDFNTIRAATLREDVLKFVSERELGIPVPETVLIEGGAFGDLNDVDLNASLKIPEGMARLQGNFQSKKQIRFNGNLKIDSVQLNKLLNNEQLGGLSLQMNFKGSGNDINTLNAEFDAEFSQLSLNTYNFSNLQLQGEINNGIGKATLDFKDENLNLTSTIDVVLDSVFSTIKLDLNIIGADLHALGIANENIKAGIQMKANFKGNAKDYELDAQLENGIAVFDKQQYRLGEVAIKATIDTIRTDVHIASDFLNGNLKSNASPQGINSSLTQQFESYFSESSEVSTESDSLRAIMNFSLYPNPIFTEVFFRDVEQFDSILVKADFDASTKKLNAELRVPSVSYKGNAIDSLNILVTGDSTNLNFSAGFAAIYAAPIHVKKTHFGGVLKNKELLLNFDSFDENEKLLHIAAEMTLDKDSTQIHINPAELLFNKKDWNIPQDNQVTIAENFLAFANVKLSRNAQELSIDNTSVGTKNEPIGINFKNFQLQNLLSFLNPDEVLVSGQLNGDFILENPFGATGIVADFKVNALEVLQNPLGNLSLDATSRGNAAYDFNLALKDGGADLDLKGGYVAAETGAELKLDLNLNRIEMKTIEGFFRDGIKDSHGAISGNISLSGTTADPKYQGIIAFDNADFNVSSLNSIFKISQETLKIDNEGIAFDNFQITDNNGSDLIITGAIRTDNLLNPSFDVSLETEEFRLLNSTKEDNELFYGTASIDADMTVKGDMELPKIVGKLRIRKVTDVTYIVPETQLDIEERSGVVVFVNRENPDAILTRNDQEEAPYFFQGLDVKAILEIAEDADFRIIIDERTGDNLRVSGDAALNLNIETNGNINLSGKYELNSGHYETSLYNLVNRRFEIKPGSTITWQGDPTDAKLDVTAIYELETSASSLMSSVTSGQDISVTNKYRQVLPFLVYLNVEGQLLEPNLSFALDMPEDEQGTLGGAVYGRIQQLNQQEASLNKQVFSLLALNRFYPDAGSDGSSGGTAAIARDNVNKVLSGELNAFSDKVFGNVGFEVDFDLDSFTDYQGESAQDRTQLNINAKKKLFDDRLIVTAGSALDVEGSAQPGQEETPIIGNVSLEYLLTKDGRYRLRGFRKSEYENIIDGQLIVTGVALIFNREFNKFSQLFNPLKDEKNKEKMRQKTAKNENND
ncbi:translocation/assembly module TamB domain-containing protein [Maribacter sp. 2307UL18-2]|uniref:translocation/assembly module TamB domain-containing protein n=1 Tax=Maribacter sp. 2307UL18-2 TaxID=3386274 RepID=UPI0039BC8BF6